MHSDPRITRISLSPSFSLLFFSGCFYISTFLSVSDKCSGCCGKLSKGAGAEAVSPAGHHTLCGFSVWGLVCACVESPPPFTKENKVIDSQGSKRNSRYRTQPRKRGQWLTWLRVIFWGVWQIASAHWIGCSFWVLFHSWCLNCLICLAFVSRHQLRQPWQGIHLETHPGFQSVSVWERKIGSKRCLFVALFLPECKHGKQTLILRMSE